MRAMVLGAAGMLGHDLVATARPGVELFPFPRAELDITDTRALAATVRAVRPDLIFNAAAYTAVDRAESEAEAAFRVNGAAVGELGRIARQADARVIHFSTDYVFDGTSAEPYAEDSPANPVNVYGASKLAGETALRASGAHYLIVRVQWLFGPHGRCFPRTMWERATARSPSRVVSDQVGRPTYSVDLAGATWRLSARPPGGVMHLANAGLATWYDVARRVYAACDAEELVQPCSTAQFPTPAKRPARVVLGTARAEQALGGPLPPWEEAIARFLAGIEVRP
jgi:dTDP-4-dehydrorhamnose reductase